MKRAIILGATGLTGSHLCQLILGDDYYDELILILRSPTDVKNDKLKQIVYDFNKPDPTVLNADHVFCCLGTTIKKAGSKEQFFKIDHDYVIDSAKFALENGAQLFSLVSAQGANNKSGIFYNRVKGDIEKSLQDLDYKTLHIFRPSLLMGDRKEFRFGERVAQVIMKGINFLIPARYKAVKSSQVAASMLKSAKSETLKGDHIFDNKFIVELK